MYSTGGRGINGGGAPPPVTAVVPELGAAAPGLPGGDAVWKLEPGRGELFPFI